MEEGEDPQHTLRFVGFPGHEAQPPPAPVSIRPISNFRRLKKLCLGQCRLNGKYFFLFDFPDLEELDRIWCSRLKWDLQEAIRGLPKLRTLRVSNNLCVTGNLRVVRGSLEELHLHICKLVEGF